MLLAIVLVALLGSGTLLTAVALGVGAWPTVGSVARAAGAGVARPAPICSAVLAEATLSFVGLTNHDVPGWGHIMAHAGPYLRDAWWMWLFPGGLLIMATAGVALLADT